MTTDWNVCCAEWMLRGVLKRPFMALCVDNDPVQNLCFAVSDCYRADLEPALQNTCPNHLKALQCSMI